MKRAVCFLTLVAFLSVAAFDGLAAESKKLQKSKKTVVEIKQEVPKETPEITVTDEHPKNPALPQPQNEPREGEEINWQVMSSGGRPSVAGDLMISGTMGQLAIGSSSSGDVGIHHGYWQDFGASYICGDADASGYVDIDDVVYILDWAFLGGPAPIPVESADVDCSGYVDIDDPVYILDYAFLGGPAPCDPDDDGVPDC